MTQNLTALLSIYNKRTDIFSSTIVSPSFIAVLHEGVTRYVNVIYVEHPLLRRSHTDNIKLDEQVKAMFEESEHWRIIFTSSVICVQTKINPIYNKIL